MMAVCPSSIPDMLTNAVSHTFRPSSPYADSPWPSSSKLSTELSSKASGDLLSVQPLGIANTSSNPAAPSPITSDTTEFADVEDLENDASTSVASTADLKKDQTVPGVPLKIETQKLVQPVKPTSPDEDEPPPSVIYAPAGFGDFRSSSGITVVRPRKESSSSDGRVTIGRTESTDSIASDITVMKRTHSPVKSLEDPEYESSVTPQQSHRFPVHDWTKTPRAQTRQDLHDRQALSVTDADLDVVNDAYDTVTHRRQEFSPADEYLARSNTREIETLNDALEECWKLCNTLASLSCVHPRSVNVSHSKHDADQRTWQSCWKLCQWLYRTRRNTSPDPDQILELCRDLCQALFDVRHCDDEVADSVLRVSFELNNHLFNTRDRRLPEAFRERTLDFYLTLCHRLTGQMSKLDAKTNDMLQACWRFVETLFSIRQYKMEGRTPHEGLISSAIQACWILSDVFRDKWMGARPESHTPRPVQTTFTQAFQQAKQSGLTFIDENGKIHPETPTTIFDDSVTVSPYEAPAPNIVVLGPSVDTNTPANGADGKPPSVNSRSGSGSRVSAYRWPNNNPEVNLAAATISEPNLDFLVGNATSTIRPGEDHTLTLLKALFARAAVLTNRGFLPKSFATKTVPGSESVNLASLPHFVQALPNGSFGSQAWEANLLDKYRATVTGDPTFKTLGHAADPRLLYPNRAEPTIAVQIRLQTARAVKSMIVTTSGWEWLKDLFKFAFEMQIEEVFENRATTQMT